MSAFAHSFNVPTIGTPTFDHVFSYPQGSYAVDVNLTINVTTTQEIQWMLYYVDKSIATLAAALEGTPLITGGRAELANPTLMVVADQCFSDIGRYHIIRQGQALPGERRHLLLLFDQTSVIPNSSVLVTGRYYSPSTIKRMKSINTEHEGQPDTLLQQLRGEALL